MFRPLRRFFRRLRGLQAAGPEARDPSTWIVLLFEHPSRGFYLRWADTSQCALRLLDKLSLGELERYRGAYREVRGFDPPYKFLPKYQEHEAEAIAREGGES